LLLLTKHPEVLVEANKIRVGQPSAVHFRAQTAPLRAMNPSGIWQPFQSILKTALLAALKQRSKHRIKLRSAMKLAMNIPGNSHD
jgi:hypothetical protein